MVVAGDDISGYDPRRLTKFRRESVGFVFQSVNLMPFLTARENLLVVADFSRRDKKKSAARADQLLGELGLGKRAANLPAQLSGGERQRVAVGRAFMNEPKYRRKHRSHPLPWTQWRWRPACSWIIVIIHENERLPSTFAVSRDCLTVRAGRL